MKVRLRVRLLAVLRTVYWCDGCAGAYPPSHFPCPVPPIGDGT